MDFIGRTAELGELEGIYSEGGHAVMVYGRRRIGKTTLLERFCEGKRNIFFRCLKDSESSNVAYFSKKLSLFIGKDVRIQSFMELIEVSCTHFRCYLFFFFSCVFQKSCCFSHIRSHSPSLS